MPNAFQDGYAFGKGAMDDLHQGIRRSKLASLASQAYGAAPQQRDQFVQQAVGVDPMAGLSIGKQLQVGEEERTQRLGVMARALVSVPEQMRPSLYRQMIPELSRFGLSELPPDYTPEVGQMAEKIHTVLSGYGSGTPAGLQEFNAMTAGMSPEDVMRARRINLGLDGRASSAGFQQVKFTDGMGRERIGVINGKTGQIDLPDGTSFNPQTGAIAPTQMAEPQSQPLLGPEAPVIGQSGGDPFASLLAAVPGLRVTSQKRTPEENARLPNSVPNSYHLTGEAIDLGTPSPEQQPAIEQWAEANGYEIIRNYRDGHWHLEPKPGTRRRVTQSADQFTSQTPQDRKYAEESGQQRAQLEALGPRGQIEAQNAAAKTEAEERVRLGLLPQRGQLEAANAAAEETAKAQAERQLALPQTIAAADSTLSLLDKVLTHPGRAAGTGIGTWNPMNRVPGTPAYDFNVLMDQIKGQAFLQAFQSLKGGGAITEREGQAATNAIARLNAAQSEKAFVESIQDLQKIVSAGKARAMSGTGKAPGAAPVDARRRALLDKY